MPIQRTAFIFPHPIQYSVERHWRDKFPGIYVNPGLYFLGDNQIRVKRGETSVEVFSSEAIDFFQSHFPEATQVTVIWEDR